MTGLGHGGASSGSKAGMLSEQDVKAVCLQSGADFVCDILREQFASIILKVNKGNDDELPFIRLSEEEEGSLEDMQRDEIGAQVIDIGENYFRRKYNYPKPAKGEKIAGASAAPTPAPGANGRIQPKPPGGGGVPEPTEEMNAAALEAQAQPVALKANLKTVNAVASAVAETLSPLAKYLAKGLEISDPAAQQEFFKRALEKWPVLAAPLKYDHAVNDALTPALVKSFLDGIKSQGKEQTK